LTYFPSKLVGVCESECEDFTVRFQEEKLDFIVESGVETIAKPQTRYFGSAF
jgi:hypothetical protein